MDDTIFIDLTTTELQPGQHFTGKILWALEKAPQEVRLTLGWFTEGRGTTDRKIEAELSLSVKKGKAEHQLPIIVSHHGQAVELSAIADDSKRSPLSFLKRGANR